MNSTKTTQCMLCETALEPFDKPGWHFSPKLDGIRIIAKSGPKSSLTTRRGYDVSATYPEVIEALETMPEMILDGEIVVLDANGAPSFHRLQQRSGKTKTLEVKFARRAHPAIFYAFDLLELNGVDFKSKPLRERLVHLGEQLDLVSTESKQVIRKIMGVEDTGVKLFELCLSMGFEGIVAKKLDSTYLEGKRSSNWVKVKKFQTEEFVVCGYTKGTGSRESTFGALVIGRYHGKEYVVEGQVGSGFSDEEIKRVCEKLNPTGKTEVMDGDTVTMVRKNIVVEVRFMEMTSSGVARQPVFLRTRPDLNPIFVKKK